MEVALNYESIDQRIERLKREAGTNRPKLNHLKLETPQSTARVEFEKKSEGKELMRPVMTKRTIWNNMKKTTQPSEELHEKKEQQLDRK